MNDVIDFLTSKELIVVYVVVLLVCISYFIIYLINRTCQNRKKKQNTKELKRLVEQIEEKLEQEQEYSSVNSSPAQIEEITQNILYVENIEEKEEVQNNIQISEIKTEESEIEAPMKKNTSLSINTVETIEQPTIAELPKEEIVEEKIENIVLDSMPSITIEEELEYTNIEPNPEEAQAELRRLTEELQKAEEETKNISLTSLEEEQEANAIISLEEFLKRSQEKHYETSVEQYEEDDENKPISIEELEKMRNQIVVESIENQVQEEISSTEVIEIKEPYQEKMILDEFNNIKIEEQEIKPYAENKKFKSSPVISPVYGIENTSIQENSMELENTANYEKLDEEIKKTNEFLMTLKELQKNLQ